MANELSSSLSSLTLKSITVHQPWANLLVMGVKRIESRTWNTNYRGHLWVHASKKPATKENLLLAERLYPGLLTQFFESQKICS